MKSYQILIAGSSKYAKLFATKIQKLDQFNIHSILTPRPRKQGRKQIIINNKVHQFALDNNIPFVLVENNINTEIIKSLNAINSIKPDFLLVIDFGYIIPTSLINLPNIDCLNIHPSDLPRWRGSSPAQFSILHGDTQSAISLIQVSDIIDSGPIYYKHKFIINKHWTSDKYYDYSFHTFSDHLPSLLDAIAQSKLHPKPQDDKIATYAHKLTKNDSFISVKTLDKYCPMINQNNTDSKNNNGLLTKLISSYDQKSIPSLIKRASLAFRPWPKLWTIIETKKGAKRMKIISCHLDKNELFLDKVQLAGKKETTFNEIKNRLVVI